jgi:hypothetical protein
MDMDRFQCNIEVDAAPSVCYQKWHHFEQFPHFMNNVEEVRRTDEKSWHWVVNGPLGHRTEWDAEVDGDEPNRLISWHSVTGSEVAVSGLVRFRELGKDRTQITCEVQYDPPGGALGEAVAHLFADPEKMVREDLANFKRLVEGTNVPVDKVHTGRVMQPNAFVVSGETGEAIGNADIQGGELASGDRTEQASESGLRSDNIPSTNEQPILSDHAYRSVETGLDVPPSGSPMAGLDLDDEDYELIYGLEDEIPPVGTSAELPSGDIEELQLLAEEESPYLGLSQGAVYSEDLIDMRNDNPFNNAENDIYAESMDVFEEDLISFTENIDSEIDIGLGSRESINSFDQGVPDAGLGPREVNQSAEDRQMNSGLPGGSDKGG